MRVYSPIFGLFLDLRKIKIKIENFCFVQANKKVSKKIPQKAQFLSLRFGDKIFY